MLGPLSVCVALVTAPVTRRLAGESADQYRAIVSGDLQTRPELLMIGLAWLVAEVPWFLASVALDYLGTLTGVEQGRLGPVTLAGIASIGVGGIYYGLRAYLAREPFHVRRAEDAVPMVAFLMAMAAVVASGVA